jgi:hypothetical protein
MWTNLTYLLNGSGPLEVNLRNKYNNVGYLGEISSDKRKIILLRIWNKKHQ